MDTREQALLRLREFKTDDEVYVHAFTSVGLIGWHRATVVRVFTLDVPNIPAHGRHYAVVYSRRLGTVDARVGDIRHAAFGEPTEPP